MNDKAEKKPDTAVKGNSPKQTMWIVGVVVLFIGMFLLSQFKQDKDKQAVKAESFSTNNNRDTSYTDRNDRPARTKPEARDNYNDEDEQWAKLQQQLEALKHAQSDAEKQRQEELWKKKEEQKRSSSLVIYSKKRAQPNNQSQSANAFEYSDQSNENGTLQLPQPDPIKVIEANEISSIGNPDNTITGGKFIHGVLETAIDSTLPGQVRALVSQHVYSENGRRVLLQKGTRLIGNYRSNVRQGQSRVFVIWDYAITPTGLQIELGSQGVDALGTAGLDGFYDSRFLERFGGAIMLSLIENIDTGNDDVSISTRDSLQNASAVALRNSINIPPKIRVDQGTKINVFVNKTIRFQ
ncbi:TrbI/VirB10 family protein [Marinicella sp. W31]|uniref:TrbI/VirB10 family protein n=1 Tax=Marinicella sp. W31 TaxID=3023713 RepID=UPI003756C2AF